MLHVSTFNLWLLLVMKERTPLLIFLHHLTSLVYLVIEHNPFPLNTTTSTTFLCLTKSCQFCIILYKRLLHICLMLVTVKAPGAIYYSTPYSFEPNTHTHTHTFTDNNKEKIFIQKTCFSYNSKHTHTLKLHVLNCVLLNTAW